jgi:hypothetical protein
VLRTLIAATFAIVVAFCLAHPAEAVACIPSVTTLCVDDQPGDGRFQVQVAWQTTQGGGQAGNGKAIPLSSLGVTNGGLMYFFEATNPELLIKILPKCADNGHYWVFASAGTNVGVTITITDLKTGAQKVYVNPDIHAMTPIQDIQAFPAAIPCVTVDPLLTKTQLLQGHWHFIYSILNVTFTNDYTLTTIPGTRNSQGGYFISGTGEFGDPVVAAYYPQDGNWSLLDPGTIIDRFYVFYTDGATILPNSCYYQIDPPGSLNFSRCYALSGAKTGPAAAVRALQDSSLKIAKEDAEHVEQAAVGRETTPVDPDVVEKYFSLKNLIH